MEGFLVDGRFKGDEVHLACCGGLHKPSGKYERLASPTVVGRVILVVFVVYLFKAV